MRHVDVERIRIRVKGPAGPWTPAAAAALGERIARALARGGLPAGTTALGGVDAGTVRAAGGPSSALASRVADGVSASVAAAAAARGKG